MRKLLSLESLPLHTKKHLFCVVEGRMFLPCWKKYIFLGIIEVLKLSHNSLHLFYVCIYFSAVWLKIVPHLSSQRSAIPIPFFRDVQRTSQLLIHTPSQVCSPPPQSMELALATGASTGSEQVERLLLSWVNSFFAHSLMTGFFIGVPSPSWFLFARVFDFPGTSHIWEAFSYPQPREAPDGRPETLHGSGTSSSSSISSNFFL